MIEERIANKGEKNEMKLNRSRIVIASVYLLIVVALFANMVIADAKYGEPSRPLTISGLAFLIIGFPASLLLGPFPLTIIMLLGQSSAWAFLVDAIARRMNKNRNHPTPSCTLS